MINALNVGLHANLSQSYVLRGGKHYFILVFDVSVSKGCSSQQLGEVHVVTLTSGGCSLGVQGDTKANGLGLVSCCLLQLKCRWVCSFSWLHSPPPLPLDSSLFSSRSRYPLFVGTPSVRVVLPEKQILLAHVPVKNKGGSFVGQLNSLSVSRQSGSYLGRAGFYPAFTVISVLSLFRPFLCS